MNFEIYAPTGKPSELMEISVATWSVKCIYGNRNYITEFLNSEEIKKNKIGIYFLLGEDEDDNIHVYIGETEQMVKRIKKHHLSKEFWNRMIAFIGENLNKSYIKFLEHSIYSDLQTIGKVKLQQNTPNNTTLTKGQISTMNDLKKKIYSVLQIFNYNWFMEEKEIVKAKVKTFVSKEGARMQVVSDGFKVLKGSVVREMNMDSEKNEYRRLREKRKNFKEEGILAKNGNGNYYFTKDYTFKSISASASFVIGYNKNGSRYWKNEEGKTYKEIEAEKLEGDS